MRDRYRDVADLYVEGEVLELRGGLQLWIQPLNSFELHDVRSRAAAARARRVAGLKREDSEEMEAVRIECRENGRDATIAMIVDHKSTEIYLRLQAEFETAEWAETLELIARQDEILHAEANDDERKALEEAVERWTTTFAERLAHEQDFERSVLEALSDEEVYAEFERIHIERAASLAQQEEYRLHEMAKATRSCDAEWDDANGRWEHKIPLMEREQVFEPEEIRRLPESLQQEIQEVLRRLNLNVREAKDSAARATSSNSSPQPSEEEEESTPSGQEATLGAPPGI